MSEQKTRMPGLGGLRGLAILFVISFHQMTLFPEPIRSIVKPGWLGVDLFFVLSGFLITGILLDEVKIEGGWRYFGKFYARRTLRIFPIYYVYLVVAYIVFHSWAAVPTIGMNWYISYLQNWKPGYGQFDGGFGHLWSLAVEEQFYLIWPLIVLLFTRRLAALCWVLIIGALSIRLWMRFGLDFNIEGVHRLTFCRIDTFAIGALAVLAIRNKRIWIIDHAWMFWVCSIAFIGSGIWLLYSPALGTIDWSLIAFGFGLIVTVVAITKNRFLESETLRKIGALSYSMYLFHQLIFAKTERIMGIVHAPHVLLLPLGFTFTILAAMFTGRFVEGPFNKMKDHMMWSRKLTKQCELV